MKKQILSLALALFLGTAVGMARKTEANVLIRQNASNRW